MTSPTGAGQNEDEFFYTNDNSLVTEISPQHSSSTDGECFTSATHLSVTAHFSHTSDNYTPSRDYTL